MITIGMNYQVIPGKEEVFERACQQVVEVMKADSGHKASAIYKDISLPGSYLIISDWNDKAAFDSFVKSEAFAKVTQWGKDNILSGRPKHTVYTS
jgi:heme-degrading monooxygenase HmoA